MTQLDSLYGKSFMKHSDVGCGINIVLYFGTYYAEIKEIFCNS